MIQRMERAPKQTSKNGYFTFIIYRELDMGLGKLLDEMERKDDAYFSFLFGVLDLLYIPFHYPGGSRSISRS
jgi:hypothetical protein